jgi:hypothetical protein
MAGLIVPSGPCITKSHSPPTRNSNARVVVVNPSGPHHRDRCRTSVNASNTSSRGALMTREITISRSAVADCAGASRRSDPAAGPGQLDRLVPVSGAELGGCGGKVVADCAGGQGCALRDFLDGGAVGGEFQHVGLA